MKMEGWVDTMKRLLVLVLMAWMVSAARGEEADVKEITVKLTVPDGGWSISIQKVYRVEDELWALSRVSRREGMAIQVISKVSDSVSVKTEDLPVKHIVLGKTWRWKKEEPYTFVSDFEEVDEALKGAKLLYEKS